MSAAAPVHAHTVPASAPLRAKGAVKGGEAGTAGSASASGIASGDDFGQYFREQAGTVAPTIPVGGSQGPEAKLASGDRAPASAEPVPAGAGLADSAPAVTLPDSPQSLLLDELQGMPHGAAVEVAAAGETQSGGDTVSTTVAPGSATEADKAKVTKGPSSLKGTDQKDKAENAASPKDATSAVPIAAVPPSAASPAALGPAPLVPLPPLKPAAAFSGKAQPARAGVSPQGVNTQKLTGDKAATPVSAADESSPTAPLAGAANQAPLPAPLTAVLAEQASSGDGKETSGTENGDARSKESSPAMPGPRASQAAAMPATAAPASLFASPAAAHSDVPSFPLPHVVSGPPAPSPSAAGSASPTGAGVLYDRLDQAAAPVVLHSGAQHVSVGVHDPNLGWVEIQTQNSGGHVDAMLVASSGQTHDSLAAQLPALAQFLEQRDVRVATLAVQQPAQASTSGSGSGSGQGGGTSSGGGMGNGTGYSGNGGADARHSGSANAGGGREARQASGFRTGRPTGISGPTSETGSGGEALPYQPLSYISVRA